MKESLNAKSVHQPTNNRNTLHIFLLIFIPTILIFLSTLLITPKETKIDALLIQDRFLTHFCIENGSFIKSKKSISFKLIRDVNPNFTNDIIQPSPSNKEALVLDVKVTSESPHRVHLVIKDNSSWQIPFNTEEPPDVKHRYHTSSMNFLTLTQERYSITIHDKDGSSLLTTKESYFRYMEKYVALEVLIPSTRLFGLGERISSVNLKEGTYILFNKYGDPIPGQNLSGMHPFLLFQLPDHKFAAIFLRTSLALEVKLLTDHINSKIRFTTIGGIIDFYCFYKGTAQFILREYQQVIGKPELPPFWAFGYHHGKASYKSLSNITDMIQGFFLSNIPLDAIWIDTDILEDGKNFIINKDFHELKKFISSHHEKQLHFILMVKAGISYNQHYDFYFEADNAKCLVRDVLNLRNHIGRDQYGDITYPNFFHPKMCPIWEHGIKTFYDNVPFDGLYFTMNEQYNVCNGDCNENSSNNSYDNLPFTPGGIPLNTTTLSMSALYLVNDTTQYHELYVHTLNNVVMANCTYNALKKVNPGHRPFLMSAATFPGTQKFTSGHFFLRTTSTWDNFRYASSVPINLGMFGQPFSGASICGYYNDTQVKLCIDWLRLGIFYPLSVNFNSKDITPQDPYEFSEEERPKYKKAIYFRYSLVRFIYTKVFQSVLYGGSPIQPLFFLFPNDDFAYRNIDRGFIYGSELLITVPFQEENQYSVYFPNDHWFKFPSGQAVWKYRHNRKEGVTRQFSTNTQTPNLFLRGGSIIPYQDAANQKLGSIAELVDVPLTLIVALNEKDEAKGEMVVDDGITDNTIIRKAYRHYKFMIKNKVLKISLLNDYPGLKLYPFEYFFAVEIWGVKSNIQSACIITYDLFKHKVAISYDELLQILSIKNFSKKVPLKNIEAIILYEEGDYDYCSNSYNADKIKFNENLNKLTGHLSCQPNSYHYKIHTSILNQQIMNLKIKPLNWTSWQVPHITKKKDAKRTFADYVLAISQRPFYFLVSYPNDLNKIILTTQDQPMTITQNFTMISLWINSTAVYGVGEQLDGKFALTPGRYTIYSYNNEDSSMGKNSYGSHPFVMFRLPDGDFAGVLFLTSNALDVDISDKLNVLTFISIGGSINLYIIQRGSPRVIIENYHLIIGRPHLPPYWSFGSHYFRNYGNVETMENVVKQFKGIPLDMLWIGIEYMDDMNSFTLDQRNYHNLSNFINYLHSKQIKFGTTLIPQIPISETNIAYKKGCENNVFIKDSEGEFFAGMSKSGYSHYIDFTHPNANEYWISMLSYFKENLFAFDGLWLDENEVTQFCDGDCESSEDIHLIYTPGHRSLEKKTLPMNAQYYHNTEFNLHSLYGHMQANATYQYFLQNNIRGLILSRGTFAGSGQFVGHIFSQVKFTWSDLKLSLKHIFSFQSFGIPLSTSLIHNSVEDIELCQRWYQLSTFYPMFISSSDSLFSYPEIFSIAEATLRLRYSLLRYIYSLHLMSSANGGTYFSPLFYEFPEDIQCLKEFSSFMIGSALKVTPALERGQTTIKSYFPNKNWYRLLDGKREVAYNSKSKLGSNITINTSIANKYVTVHIKGGSIIPFQSQSLSLPKTVHNLTNQSISLIVALDSNNEAKGFAVFDEGEGSNSLMHKEYHWFLFECNKNELLISLKGNNKYIRSKELRDETIEQIKIYGLNKCINTKYAYVYLINGTNIQLDANYNCNTKILTIIFKTPLELLKIRSVRWEQ